MSGNLWAERNCPFFGRGHYTTGHGLENGERFYADDLGTPVGEQLSGVGARPDDGEVQDSDVGEGEGFRAQVRHSLDYPHLGHARELGLGEA